MNSKQNNAGIIFKLGLFTTLLVLIISGQRAWTQEVPNGDTGTLWRIKTGSGLTNN